MLDNLNCKLWAKDIARVAHAQNNQLISDEEKEYWLSTDEGKEILELLKIKRKQLNIS